MGGRCSRRNIIAVLCDAFAAAVCAVNVAFLYAEAAASCVVIVFIKNFTSSACFFLKLSSAKCSSCRLCLKLLATPPRSGSGVGAGDRLSSRVGAVSVAITRSARLLPSVFCSVDLARRRIREAFGEAARSARAMRAASSRSSLLAPPSPSQRWRSSF